MFSLDILRQTIDLKSQSPLFENFMNIGVTSHKGLVLAILPRIFGSFIQCIKKYRSSLFSQGLNQYTAAEEARAAGMRFFVSCQSLLHEADSSNGRTWSTRAALLTLVETENLFSRHQPDAELVLSQNIELAIHGLICDGNGQFNCIKDSSIYSPVAIGQTEVPTLAVEILSVLTRIDYDLIAPFISHVLRQLLLVRHYSPETTCHRLTYNTIARYPNPINPFSHFWIFSWTTIPKLVPCIPTSSVFSRLCRQIIYHQYSLKIHADHTKCRHQGHFSTLSILIASVNAFKVFLLPIKQRRQSVMYFSR
jgi:hypothetical protein